VAGRTGRSSAQILAWVKQWIAVVEDAFPGRRVGVYTSAGWVAWSLRWSCSSSTDPLCARTEPPSPMAAGAFWRARGPGSGGTQSSSGLAKINGAWSLAP
jgi:hypothetical protein